MEDIDEIGRQIYCVRMGNYRYRKADNDSAPAPTKQSRALLAPMPKLFPLLRYASRCESCSHMAASSARS